MVVSTSNTEIRRATVLTFLGNSGSPVLRKKDNIAIGVHVYGGDLNSASVIGIHGNQFLDYAAAFDLEPTTIKIPGDGPTKTPGIQYVRVPTSKTPDVNQGVVNVAKGPYSHFTPEEGFLTSNGNTRLNGKTSDSTSNGTSGDLLGLNNRGGLTPGHKISQHFNGGASTEMDEEGFFEFFKTAISVGAPILGNVARIGLPIAFGPLGGVIGALAGTALSKAGELAGGAAEGGMVDSISNDDVIKRAVYAEAALQAMLKINREKLEEEGFIDDMKTVVSKLAPVAKRVAPKILAVIKDDVIQLLLEQLKNGKTEAELEVPARKTQHKTSSARPRMTFSQNTGPESFAQHVAAAGTDEEGFVDILATSAKLALPFLGKLIASFAESDFVDDEVPSSVVAGLGHRAVLAEAALQAALNAPHDFLEEEGFFDTFASVVGSSKLHFIFLLLVQHLPSIFSSKDPCRALNTNMCISWLHYPHSRSRCHQSCDPGRTSNAQRNSWS
jgi:hypothetical protein